MPLGGELLKPRNTPNGEDALNGVRKAVAADGSAMAGTADALPAGDGWLMKLLHPVPALFIEPGPGPA